MVRFTAVAIVRDNRDPSGLARVKVGFPWHSRPEDSYWARLATPMAGKGYGAFFLPEVNDEVIVAFERGDLRFTLDEGSITIDAENGNRIVIGSANGTTTIEAASTLRIRAPQIAIEASGTLDIKAGGTLTLRGSLVAIN
jgi:phage baseplate assembly protein gpV